MTTINEGKELKLDTEETELDQEDELDGWGPVRVRRSSIPARPSVLAASPETENRESAVQAPRIEGERKDKLLT